MSKVSILVHRDELNQLVDRLHESGLMQITEIRHEHPELLKELEPASMDPEVSNCASYELRLSRIIEILDRFYPKPKGIKALLHPEIVKPKRVSWRALEEIYKDAAALLDKVENKIIETEQQINKVREKSSFFDHQAELVKDLIEFNFDLAYLGKGEWAEIKAGKVDDLASLKEAISGIEVELFSRERKKGRKRYNVVVLCFHKADEEIVSNRIKKIFSEYKLEGIKGKPLVALKSFVEEKDKLEREKQEAIAELQSIYEAENRDLLALKEEISIQKERKEAPVNFAKSNFTYLIKGWSLKRDVDKLKKVAKESTQDQFAFLSQEAETNPDGPPIYLEQSSWVKPFKPLLTLFALPKYDEIDPTPFLGIVFAIFFGLMLGDAGYGLILLSLSLLGLLKFAKLSPTLKQWSYIGLWLGITTTLAGFVFGNFFGNLLQTFWPNYFPEGKLYPSTIKGISFPFPIDAIHKPMLVLGIMLVVGLIHLNIGFGIATYQNWNRRHYKEILFRQDPWFILQPAGGLLICEYIIHWPKGFKLSPEAEILTLAGVLVGVGLIFAGKGIIGFFDITGFVGDLLSYTRLLALGLATSGIAIGFNMVGKFMPKIIGSALIGLPITILILSIGHIFNLAIQSLGAGIHSLRLQYVEFFNRFYEGGGKEFTPFKVKRQYTSLE
jgi:V/A-type H+-transporting ATPase subunit I